MICRYCKRDLPKKQFPLKPGMKNARYKTCRECHALGHSCIEKPKPEPHKVMTPEERAVHMREYYRNYRAAHRDKIKQQCRDSARRRYNGEGKRKPGPKPKPKPVTKTCIVCGRELPSFMFDSADGKRTHSSTCIDCREKAKQNVAKQTEPEPATKVCRKCGRELPIESFEFRKDKVRRLWHCKDCRSPQARKMAAYLREYRELGKEPVKPKEQPPKPQKPEKGCKKCWLYPCFQGIDNLETDFSLYCKSFKPKN